MFEFEILKKDYKFLFWMFIHNAVIHPMLAFPIQFKIIQYYHDWTAKKCWNAG